jgi:hypothetical protein
VIRHIFLWNVAPNADPDEIIRLLNEFRKLSWVRGWEIGKHQGPRRYENTWEYGLTVDFDSLEDYNRYADHPLHGELVPKIVPMFATRAVVDIELSDNPG